jgi:beta-glucanase (GH16 family)
MSPAALWLSASYVRTAQPRRYASQSTQKQAISAWIISMLEPLLTISVDFMSPTKKPWSWLWCQQGSGDIVASYNEPQDIEIRGAFTRLRGV